MKKIEVLIATIPEIDQEWTLVISEALFHLRAALDYLTWELALWNLQKQTSPGEPARNTQYPLSTTEKDFNSGQVRDLDPGHVAVTKWLQPYSSLHLAQVSPEPQSFGAGIPLVPLITGSRPFWCSYWQAARNDRGSD